MSIYAVSSDFFQHRNNEESWEYIDPDQVVQPLQTPEPPFHQSVNIKEEDEDENSAHQQLDIFQRLYSPIIEDQKYRARREYESAKVLHARGSSIGDWCNDFLAAYLQAKELNLPEAHGFRPHRDLIQTISHIEPGYSAALANNILKAEKTWNRHRNQPIPQEFHIRTILRNFVRHHLNMGPEKAETQTGTTAAKYNNKESPHSNRRGKNNSKPKKPCLCGDSHFWGQCPYIDTSQRSGGFVEDPEKVKKVWFYESKDKKGVLNKIRERNRGYRKLKTKSSDQETEPDSIGVSTGDDATEHNSRQSYIAFSSTSNHQLLGQRNPLLHSWTLSSTSNVHVCNNANEFVWKAPAAPDDVVFAGASEVRIEAWGEVNVPLTTTNGTKTTTLKRVALIPSFFTSLVSLGRLSSSNVHFDSGKSILYRGGIPPEHIANVSLVGGHWLLVHRTEPPSSTKELVIIES